MRALAAFVLLLLGALLVPVATVGWWAHDSVVSTPGYVDTVAPLATDPAVVAEVEDRFVDRVTTQLSKRTDATAPRVLTPVRAAVAQVVTSPAFARAWRVSNTSMHRQLVAVLAEDPGSVRVRRGGTVELRLGSLSADIKRELVTAKVPFAAQLAPVQATYPVGTTTDLARGQRAYHLLDRWGRLLAVASLLLIVLGLVVARRRGRALAWTAVVALLGIGVVALGLVLGRVAAPTLIPDGISSAAAEAVFDVVTAGLRRDLLLVAAGAVVAFVLGVLTARRSRRRTAED